MKARRDTLKTWEIVALAIIFLLLLAFFFVIGTGYPLPLNPEP